MGYIYVIENKINNKKYVGQTTNPTKRWKKHKIDDVKNPNLIIGKAFIKYGIENFTFSIIEECPDDMISEKEQYWINKLNTYCKNKNSLGYNMTKGGEAMFGDSNPFYGKTHSDETKKTLSKLAKERVGERNPFYGHSHSEETKQRISKANKGRKQTAQEKKQRSEKQLGNKNHFYGKHHSDATKNKISQANSGRVPKSAIPYNAKNDIETLYFRSTGKILKWLKENNYVDNDFTISRLKTALKNSENKHILFANHYWYKSVETIPDECKGVESEIGTDSKCTASINIDEEIVHTSRNTR